MTISLLIQILQSYFFQREDHDAIADFDAGDGKPGYLVAFIGITLCRTVESRRPGYRDPGWVPTALKDFYHLPTRYDPARPGFNLKIRQSARSST